MAKSKTEGSTEKNGVLVFETMGKGFEIPGRSRLGAYDEVLKQLKDTEEVVIVYHAGKDPKPANTRRKSLLSAAKSKKMDVTASVRCIDGDNVLLAQYNGELKE